MTRRLHVGVIATNLVAWGGGIDFLRLLLGALARVAESSNIRVTLLLPEVADQVSRWQLSRDLIAAAMSRRPIDGLRRFYWQCKTVSPAAAERQRVLAAVLPEGSAVAISNYAGDDGLSRAVRRLRVDVVLPSMVNLGRDFPVPWAGYIPDFQHRHLPAMFADTERRDRDRAFAALLGAAPGMIVTSEAVKRDVAHQCPGRDPSTIVVLPFSPTVRAEWFEDGAEDVRSIYQLPDRYFVVSSQFWRHKSHVTAIDALALLRAHEARRDVKLVCTGATHDYRHPGYFDELMGHIEALGLSKDVLVVGHVPKRHQIDIIKRAVALVQPTLFEGTQGGLAVYEAVGLGVRCIVSDIPVNKEIDDPLVRFFRAGDADSLSQSMATALDEVPPAISARHQLELSDRRVERLGSQLIHAASVLSRKNAPADGRTAVA